MMEYILEKELVDVDSNNEVTICKGGDFDWLVWQVVGTSLGLAHMMCYDKCIGVLEKFNADVNMQNKVNWCRCTWRWNDDVVDVQYSQTALHEAVGSGNIDHCSYLISGARDIDKPGFVSFVNEEELWPWRLGLDGIYWSAMRCDWRIRGAVWWVGEERCWLCSIRWGIDFINKIDFCAGVIPE